MVRRWTRVLITTLIVQHVSVDADTCHTFSCSRVRKGKISCDALWSDVCAAHDTGSLRVRAVCPNECPPLAGTDIEPWQVCRAMLFAADTKMEHADQFTSAEGLSSNPTEHPAGTTRHLLGACADEPDAAAKILKLSSGTFTSCGVGKRFGYCASPVEC